MPSRPLVSIILSVRNASDCLSRALASLRSQTLDDFEAIIIDDGSEDKGATIEIIKQFSEDNRFKPYLRPHAGLSRALEFGINQARGKYLARLDADDVCHPRRLELQAGLLEASPRTGLASCLVAYGGDALANAGYARHVNWLNSLRTPREIRLGVFRDAPLAHPSAMFRSELPKLYGGYRHGQFPEDYELWLRWFENGVRAAKVEQELLTWNDSPARLSRVSPNYAPEAFFRLKAPYLAAWLARNNPWHPSIQVLGAGRLTRRRAEPLRQYGVEIEAWYEVDPKKIGLVKSGSPVRSMRELPEPGQGFIVSYVASAGAPERVTRLLADQGYVLGRDFVLAA